MRFGISTRATFEGCCKGQGVFLPCCWVCSGDEQSRLSFTSLGSDKKGVGSSVCLGVAIGTFICRGLCSWWLLTHSLASCRHWGEWEKHVH